MQWANADLVFEVLADARLVVSCQSKFNPSDAEWDSWLGVCAGLNRSARGLRLLVVTDGGHPTKAQLDRLRAVNKSNPRTAIVSPSAALRFLASALMFMNPTICCFAPTQLDAAFGHIRLAPAHQLRARAMVDRLQLRLAPLSRAG